MQEVNAIFISHCLMLCNAILTCCKLLHLSVVFITNFYIKLWYVTNPCSFSCSFGPQACCFPVGAFDLRVIRRVYLQCAAAAAWALLWRSTLTTVCSWRRPRARRCGAASPAARRCPTAGITSTATRRSARPAPTARPPIAASTPCAPICASSTPRSCSNTKRTTPRRRKSHATRPLLCSLSGCDIEFNSLCFRW